MRGYTATVALIISTVLAATAVADDSGLGITGGLLLHGDVYVRYIWDCMVYSLEPRPSTQMFSQLWQKSLRRPGIFSHVMCAAVDVTVKQEARNDAYVKPRDKQRD